MNVEDSTSLELVEKYNEFQSSTSIFHLNRLTRRSGSRTGHNSRRVADISPAFEEAIQKEVSP